jgi:hypothetical protein
MMARTTGSLSSVRSDVVRLSSLTLHHPVRLERLTEIKLDQCEAGGQCDVLGERVIGASLTQEEPGCGRRAPRAAAQVIRGGFLLGACPFRWR